MPTRSTATLATHLARLADPAETGVPDAELLRRFARTRDEAAFELLVWRHGGLVLGACRRVLGGWADADDAFQATFLALARRPGAVRRGESLAGWLHRVAVRAATRLRAQTARRAALPLPELAAPPVPLPDDTAAVIDEEIARLPDKLRVAFVLCALDGRTDTEAAAQLGCPKGTVVSRLSRARERLRERLARRGLTPVAAAALTAAPTGLSAALVAGAVRAATGPAVACARVAALADDVLRTQTLAVWKPVAAVLVAALVAAAGAVAAGRLAEGPKPMTTPPPAAATSAPKAGAGGEIKLATADEGQVRIDRVQFAPDGKRVLTRGSKTTGRWTDYAVVLWDTATGKKAHAFPRDTSVGFGTTFSPDSRLLALASGGSAPATLHDTAMWKAGPTFAHLFAGDVRFAPTGNLVLTRSSGKFRNNLSGLKAWDTATGKAVWEFGPDGEEQFADAAFSPDGKSVVLCSDTGTTRLLDAGTGNVRYELKVRERAENLAAFSPDGKRVLTWTTGFEQVKGEASGAVRLWDAATGKLERTFPRHGIPVVTAGLSPDGKHVVAASTSGGRIFVWETATGKVVAEFNMSGAQFAVSAALTFSPDGRLFAVSGGEGKATPRERTVTAVFDLPSGKERARLPGVRALAFSPDGATAALVVGPWKAADGPDEVFLRPVAALVKAAEPPPPGERFGNDRFLHPAAVSHVLFSPDGKEVATLGRGALRWWALPDGTLASEPITPDDRKLPAAGSLMTISADNSTLVTVKLTPGRGSVLAVLDPRAGTFRHTIAVPDGVGLDRLRVSHNGKWAVGFTGKAVVVWNLADGKKAAAFDAPGVQEVAVSNDGKLVALTVNFTKTEIRTADTGELAWEVTKDYPPPPKEFANQPNTEMLSELAFSPDGARLATTGTIALPGAPAPAPVRVWDVATRKHLWHTVVRHGEVAHGLRFAPDGKHVGVVATNLFLLDAGTGKVAHEFPVRAGATGAYALSNDGKRAAMAAGNRLHLWDVATHKEPDALAGPRSPARLITRSSDGRTVVTAHGGPEVWLWRDPAGPPTAIRVSDRHGATELGFGPDAQRLVTVTRGDAPVRVWDAATGKQQFALSGRADTLHRAALGRHGLFAVVDYVPGRYDPDTGKAVWTGKAVPAFGNKQPLVVISANAEYFATDAGVFAVEDGREVAPFSSGHPLAVSDDGKRVVYKTADGKIGLHQTTSVRQPDPVAAGAVFAISPGCDRAAVVIGLSLRVIDPTSGKAVAECERPAAVAADVWATWWARGVQFSPDGKLVVARGETAGLGVWDAETGTAVAWFEPDRALPLAAFSFTGPKAVTAAYGAGDLIRVWSVEPTARR